MSVRKRKITTCDHDLVNKEDSDDHFSDCDNNDFSESIFETNHQIVKNFRVRYTLMTKPSFVDSKGKTLLR